MTRSGCASGATAELFIRRIEGRSVSTTRANAPLAAAGAPGAVGMGNPHCVFIVDDAEAVQDGVAPSVVEGTRDLRKKARTAAQEQKRPGVVRKATSLMLGEFQDAGDGVARGHEQRGPGVLQQGRHQDLTAPDPCTVGATQV